MLIRVHFPHVFCLQHIHILHLTEQAILFLSKVHISDNTVLLSAQQARLCCFSMPHCCANVALLFQMLQFATFSSCSYFLKFVTLHLAESVLCVYNAHLSFLFNYSFTVMTSYIHTSGCHQLRLLTVYYL